MVAYILQTQSQKVIYFITFYSKLRNNQMQKIKKKCLLRIDLCLIYCWMQSLSEIGMVQGSSHIDPVFGVQDNHTFQKIDALLGEVRIFSLAFFELRESRLQQEQYTLKLASPIIYYHQLFIGVPHCFIISKICPISDSVWKSTDPSAISQKMHPIDQISTAKSQRTVPKSSSGALYQRVYISLDMVESLCPTILASPKSAILTTPCWLMSTFWGFKSRWNTFLLCIYCTPYSICFITPQNTYALTFVLTSSNLRTTRSLFERSSSMKSKIRSTFGLKLSHSTLKSINLYREQKVLDDVLVVEIFENGDFSESSGRYSIIFNTHSYGLNGHNNLSHQHASLIDTAIGSFPQLANDLEVLAWIHLKHHKFITKDRERARTSSSILDI